MEINIIIYRFFTFPKRCTSQERECNVMEKYYCDNCRLLYNEEEVCAACGILVTKKIYIEVQKHHKNHNGLDASK